MLRVLVMGGGGAGSYGGGGSGILRNSPEIILVIGNWWITLGTVHKLRDCILYFAQLI